FSATTGRDGEGTVDLNWAYVDDLSDYERVEIWRAPGDKAPQCGQDDSERVTVVTKRFAATDFTDDSQSTIGARFSYRACIYDSSDNKTDVNIAEGVQARDTSAPNSLVEFKGQPGQIHGTIALSFEFPADTSDYSAFEIRRVPGPVAPV